jgi:hypothetical protein
MAMSLALPGLIARCHFVYDVDHSFAANNLAGGMARFQRAQRGSNFHWTPMECDPVALSMHFMRPSPQSSAVALRKIHGARRYGDLWQRLCR